MFWVLHWPCVFLFLNKLNDDDDDDDDALPNITRENSRWRSLAWLLHIICPPPTTSEESSVTARRHSTRSEYYAVTAWTPSPDLQNIFQSVVSKLLYSGQVVGMHAAVSPQPQIISVSTLSEPNNAAIVRQIWWHSNNF